MAGVAIAIGQAKRDISDLVDRVAYGHEHILLTSQGRPKAALVSIADYEQLQQVRRDERLVHWQAWLAESDALAAQIMARRRGQPLDVEAWRRAARADLEARSEYPSGS